MAASKQPVPADDKVKQMLLSNGWMEIVDGSFYKFVGPGDGDWLYINSLTDRPFARPVVGNPLLYTKGQFMELGPKDRGSHTRYTAPEAGGQGGNDGKSENKIAIYVTSGNALTIATTEIDEKVVADKNEKDGYRIERKRTPTTLVGYIEALPARPESSDETHPS